MVLREGGGIGRGGYNSLSFEGGQQKEVRKLRPRDEILGKRRASVEFLEGDVLFRRLGEYLSPCEW